MMNAAPASRRTRAVQYLRMSTDQQSYSLANQTQRIGAYAQARGLQIVGSYIDEGQSGLSLRGRRGLQALLADVIATQRDFDHVLVLDVSRWGRFQNPDEAAHYEFLCRTAGVNIVYCAEAFETEDPGPTAALIKSVKRVMAGEYSRELSEKISFAQLRAAERGWRQGGFVPYGFDRELVTAGGRVLGRLAVGEHKAIQSHRVRLVHGSLDHIRGLRQIFAWRGQDGLSMVEIARRLSTQGVAPPEGRRWNPQIVYTILHNELAIGYLVHGKTRAVLGAHSRPATKPPVRVKVVEPVVSERLFYQAQRQTKHYDQTDKELLAALKRHLIEQNGDVSIATLNACPYLPCTRLIKARFGPISEVYRRIGALPMRAKPAHAVWDIDTACAAARALHKTHGYISRALIEASPDLPSMRTIYQRMGSMTAFYERAGLGETAEVSAAARRERLRLRRQAIVRDGPFPRAVESV